MTSILLVFGCLLLMMMLPLFYRVLTGPTAIDRIVAVNIIGTKTAILLVVIGTIFGRVEMFVDFALTYAMLNFVGSLAASRFYHKKHVREGADMPHEEAAHEEYTGL